MRHLHIIACTLALVLAVAGALAAGPAPSNFRVVVHPSNPLTALDRTFLEDAFLKKRTRWPNDALIRAADLPPTSAVRSLFSTTVLHRSVAAVIAYWQQQIFSGHAVPPPELESDAQVVAFVLAHEDAVGYVSGTCDLAGSKPVLVNQ